MQQPTPSPFPTDTPSGSPESPTQAFELPPVPPATPVSTLTGPTPTTGRRSRRRRLLGGALAALVVLVLAAAVLIPAADGDTGPDTATAAGEHDGDGRRPGGRPKTAADDGSTTSTTAFEGDLGTGSDGLPGSRTSGGSSGVPTGDSTASGPQSPRLEVVGDVVLDDGIYETDLILHNTGTSALDWSGSSEPSDTMSPSSGVIPAGGQAVVHLTADQYAHNTKDWTHVFTFHSNGGDAEVRVHGTTLLPPMLDLDGGSYVAQSGSTFGFPTGAINAVFLFKNEGDLLLEMDLSPAANLRVLGPSHVTIEGGQTTNVGFALCGIPAPAVATQVDATVYVDAGPAGQGTLTLEFHLNAGQMTGPC